MQPHVLLGPYRSAYPLDSPSGRERLGSSSTNYAKAIQVVEVGLRLASPPSSQVIIYVFATLDPPYPLRCRLQHHSLWPTHREKKKTKHPQQWQ